MTEADENWGRSCNVVLGGTQLEKILKVVLERDRLCNRYTMWACIPPCDCESCGCGCDDDDDDVVFWIWA